MSKTKNPYHSTTQLFLDIYDITNDMIILADGAVSLVISVSAMNFGLLSENEQDATIYAYAALLNSLSYSIQIVIRSQPKDVTAYLKRIQDTEEQTTNTIYKQKIKEYRSFVESLVQEQNVLDKKFYIVIPLSAIEMGLATKSVVPGAKSNSISNYEKSYIIDKAKTNLYPRRDHLIDQLARIGLYSRQLTTQELIQMLYSSYNPESYEGLKVTNTSNYTTPLVKAQIQGDFSMPTQTPATNTTPDATLNTPQPITPAAVTQPSPVPTQSPSTDTVSEPITPIAPPVSPPTEIFTGVVPPTPTIAQTQENQVPLQPTPIVNQPVSTTMPTNMPPEQDIINQTLGQAGLPTPPIINPENTTGNNG